MRLQPVIDHHAVTAPRQARSQRTFERILAALGELLAEKSFDQVAMAELAQRAGCAVTSIYARFKDKRSMIAANSSGTSGLISRIGRNSPARSTSALMLTGGSRSGNWPVSAVP